MLHPQEDAIQDGALRKVTELSADARQAMESMQLREWRVSPRPKSMQPIERTRGLYAPSS
jgi:hypothetical protein